MFYRCFCYDSKSATVQNLVQESGFDRVKRMYVKNEYNLMSPELFYAVQNAKITVGVSAIVGAAIHGLHAKNDYIRKNVASTYESQFLARRNLTDSITLAAFKGGIKYAIKYGSFSSLYLLSTMTAASYHNKVTIRDHIATGAILGGLARLNYGLKGMAVASGLGGVLGGFFGGILVLSMWLSNVTLDDLRKWQSDQYYEMKSQQNKER